MHVPPLLDTYSHKFNCHNTYILAKQKKTFQNLTCITDRIYSRFESIPLV